jgi:hypothetical protein
MRFLITGLSILIVSSILALDQPERARAFVSAVAHRSDRLWNEKEVWISGVSFVNRQDLESLMPKEESVLSWTVNGERIESALRSHPLIKDATISPCAGSWWGCFSVSVVEREPRVVILVGERGWLIGDDGGVMTHLPAERSAAIARGAEIAEFSTGRVPVIDGIVQADESPDLVKARLSQVIQVIDSISGSLNLDVDSVRVKKAGEMHVSFLGVPWSAVFDARLDDQWLSRIQDQTARLSALRTQHEGSLESAREIDLAFERVAVVRRAEGAAELGKSP